MYLFWQINVTNLLHFTTSGKCNTYDTSINNNTNIIVGSTKNLFKSFNHGRTRLLAWRGAEAGAPFQPKGANMRKLEQQFNEYLDYCRDVRRMSEQTIHGKSWICKNLLESENVQINRIEELTNKHINDWVKEQTARGCSGRTVNGRLVNVVAMIRYFQDMGVIIPGLKLRFVMKQKEEPIHRVYYSKSQIDNVLRFADRLEWLAISLCFDCGFRITELRNLRLMDFDGRRVTFVGKGSKSREAYISEETREKLDDWIRRERITDYLWEVETSKKVRHLLSVEELRYRMRKPFYRAGFVNFHPHSLRHSFATDIVENGASLEVTKEMLGHSNVTITERYVHSFEGHLSEYFDQYKFAPQMA